MSANPPPPLKADGTKPKHALLAGVLEREVRQMPSGAPIKPVSVLMEQFQVSQGTVVHALRHLRSKGLIAKPAGKKRLVAVGRQKRGEAVLNVLLLRPQWSSPDYDAMSFALLEEASRQRLHLETAHYGLTSRGEWDSHIRSHDALVVLPSAEESSRLFSLIEESLIPAVMLWEEPSAPGMLCVADDDLSVGRKAAEHLLGLGHKKVMAFLSEPPVSGMRRRLTGWEQAMRESGERHPEHLIIDCSVDPGKDAIVGSYEKLRRWLFQNGNKLPGTSVFCLCWTGALGMLRALREVGIEVPRDVSILSHGGENRLCEFSNPALSVVQGSVSETAEKALGLLKEVCLGNSPAETTILIPPTIIERQSTRKIHLKSKSSP